MSTQPASIDHLAPTKSLIDLTAHSQGEFSIGEDFVLSKVFCDIILVEFVDMANSKEDVVNRGGIYVPTNSLIKAWRKGKVILAGSSVKQCQVGDIVIFPNDKGVTVANIEVENHGKLNRGSFLNEERIFGVCKKINENNITSFKRSTKK